jgi:holliday junction DNA helicase RuvA
MIGRIAGRLDWKGVDSVLIDCRGVGYIVHVNDRTLAALPPAGEATALYTDLLVREDLLQLFGFPTLLEREWHRLLMTVQGVGAKASMSILGALGAEGVARAITLGDARAVQSAPGVGPKLAQRVILELKAKAPGLMALGGRLGGAVPADIEVVEPVTATTRPPRVPEAPGAAAASADALSALINLGYPAQDAAAAIASAASPDPAADTPSLIRAALRQLAPRG